MTELFKPRGDPRPQAAQRRLFDIRQVPRAAPPMTPEQRYPRGYTPGRMREVRAATENVISVPSYGEPGYKTEPCPTCGGKGHSPQWTPPNWILTDKKAQEGWAERGVVRVGNQLHVPGGKCFTCGGKGKLRSPVSSSREMAQTVDHPFYAPHGQRMMQEALARSTVPMGHLGGLSEILLESERRVGHTGMSGTYGLYSPSVQRIRMFPLPAKSPKRGPSAGKRIIEPIGQRINPMIAMGFESAPKVTTEGMVPVRDPSQVQQSEGTMIHEIGHHVSKGPAGPEEEAAADRYMVEHWRPDPRDVRRQRAANMRNMTYLGRGTGRYNMDQFRSARLPGGESGS